MYSLLGGMINDVMSAKPSAIQKTKLDLKNRSIFVIFPRKNKLVCQVYTYLENWSIDF